MKRLFWPGPGERLLPAVSAVLLALSFPPLHTLIPPFVGLVPFVLWIHALPPDQEGRLAAIRGSTLFGLIYFGLIFYWILVALIWFTWLSIFAFLGSMVLLTGVGILFGWMLHRMVHSVRVPLWLAVPVAWTAAEWFRAHWPSSLSFPWLGLGTSLTGFPELVGAAELVGARGLTFWMALVNGLVAGLVLAIQRGESWVRHAVVILLVVASPMAWGVWRAGSLEMREAGTVAVVQPNIPEHIKLDGDIALDSTFASLDRLMPSIEPGSVDLVVLPEVALPQTFPGLPSYAPTVARLQAYTREIGAPLLFGGLGVDFDEEGDFTPFNSTFLMEPQGLTDYRYDKRYLVPIVERVPFIPAALMGGLPYTGIFGVGQGWPIAEVDETRYAPLICYESTYPEGARTFRREGADVLVNVTNDSWYGREALWARTTALWQHPAHLVMRAIENRMGVARSANTGISLFVDPVGRVYNVTELFEADVRIDTVWTTDRTTFYTRFGDLTGNAAALAALMLVLASVWFERGPRSLDPRASDV